MTLLRNLTIRQQLTLALAVSTLVVAFLVGLGQVQARRLQGMQDESTARVEDAIRVTEAAGMAAKVYRPIADAQISGNVAGAREEWMAITKEAGEDLEACDQATRTPEQKATVREAQATYRGIVELYEKQMAPKLEAAGASTPETVALDEQIDVQVTKMQDDLTEFVASLQEEAKASNAEFDATSSTYATIGLVVGVVGLVFALGIGAFVTINVNRTLGHVVGQMREGAEQVMSAASQVAVSSQSLSQGATEQAASLEETSASMEEMASMTRMNADNAHQAATLMAEVDAQVATSNRMLGQMVTAMASIRDSSARVSKIIKTIDEIAFQTNILALNAAVEAARAGEAGMGFAVVADEVRNLAQRAAQAARDTASLIDEARQNAEQGGQTVEQVAAAIAQFTASVSRVKGIAEEVNTASRQQAQGIDQVTQAVSQMEKVTQTTAATAEESAAASEELNAQAEVTVQLVRELETMVGGGTAPAPVAGSGRAHSKKVASASPKIVKMAPAGPSKSAEEQIPLEGTGSFGRF